METIFLVEDDTSICNSICRHLESWNYQVACVTDFAHVMEEFVKADPKLVLLDIGLPFFNGYHWCKEIRKISKLPILFISSASDNMNIIMAMNMGADDFIAKPFDLHVLTAKLQALLRRAYDFGGQGNLLSHKDVVLNVADATVHYETKSVELTKNELRILQTLMETSGKIVSRDRLMERLWETDCFVDENTLSVNVTRLRRKLEELGLTDFITTKKGLGYLVE